MSLKADGSTFIKFQRDVQNERPGRDRTLVQLGRWPLDLSSVIADVTGMVSVDLRVVNRSMDFAASVDSALRRPVIATFQADGDSGW